MPHSANYDDSASTASVELAKYNLKHHVLPGSGLARTHEFLNYEDFDASGTEKLGIFDIAMGLEKRHSANQDDTTEYNLGVYIASPAISGDSRKKISL